MGVLTSDELRQLRREFERDQVPINFSKAEANLVFQAIEDEWETNTRSAMSTAIEAAHAGLTNQQKKAFGRPWLGLKFKLGG